MYPTPPPRTNMIDAAGLLTEGTIPRLIIGGVLFWAPGLAWAWALARELGPTRWIPISLVLAFTVQPLTLLFLNLLFAIPITLGTTSLLASALTLAGITIGLAPRTNALFTR